MDNYFVRLNQINVNEHIEKKGQFSYLSWPFAVAQLRLADPTATWEIRRFDGLPYLRSETGYFVEVAVTGALSTRPVFIADGHHRYETALRYSEEQTATAGAGAHPRGRHRYFMVFFANGDDPNLVVFPTHRHVHSLSTWGAASFDELAARAKVIFDVQAKDGGPSSDALLAWLNEAPTRPAFVVAAPDGRAVRLSLKSGVDLTAHATVGKLHPTLQRTDVGLLHAGVLEHILGITPEAQAAKTNLWYPQDARAALADLRAGKGQLLALMNATPVADVRTVAEAGEVMPQKSTFFYPKVLTGLAIHTLEVDVPVG